MNPVSSAESTERIAGILAAFRRKGIKLWVEQGQLRYAAPKGVVSQGEIADLRASKDQLVAILQDGAAVEAELLPRAQLGPAPLTYSQRAHWNLYRLHECRAIRQVASATRLIGQLNIELLHNRLSHVVRQHEALRTRIVVLDGQPMQKISEASGTELSVDDLTELPDGERWPRVLRIVDEHILEPIDVAVGPLFGARLLRVRNDEHVLILAMEHIISDASSLGILLRDILMVYTRRSHGRAGPLASASIQFADYAVWQRGMERSWLRTHRAYWHHHIAACGRLRFPQDQYAQLATRSGIGTVAIRMNAAQKQQLRELSRLSRTTLTLSIFAAYAGLVLRWCGVSEGIVLYVTDGRVSPKLENTVGCFAAALYLRVRLENNDTFMDLAGRIMEEYCAASEHADHSYLTAHEPCAEFTRNTAFNWIPHVPGSGPSSVDPSLGDLECSPVAFTHPMLRTLESDRDPGVQFYDAEDGIDGLVSFSRQRFSDRSMQRFARNFQLMLEKVVAQPDARISNIALV